MRDGISASILRQHFEATFQGDILGNAEKLPMLVWVRTMTS
jgi:hypothetical protein